MWRARVVSAVIVVLAASLAAGAAPALAAGPSLKITNVAYDPPSGPGDPNCKAPLPSMNGTGNASYKSPDGSATSSWQWSVPETLTSAGATATTSVADQTSSNGGHSAAIAFKVPFEFGANAGSRQQIIATVPVGAPGSAMEHETYTLKPTRAFIAGEKLYARVEIGCANYVYEYTGQPGEDDDVVTLSGVTRKVEVSRNESGWEPGTNGLKLRSGDRVHTGFKSDVVLTFPDGSRLRVGPFALLQITDVRRGPQGGVSVRVFLKLGEVTAQVNRSTGAAGDFHVKTPTTTAGVRGTVFSIGYDGSATTVAVTESSVLVTANSGASVVVPAGMETRSTAKTAGAPVPIGQGFKRGGLTSGAAIDRLSGKLSSGLRRCGLGVVSTRLAPVKSGWNARLVIVRAKQGIAAKPRGTARFRVSSARVRGVNGLARRIAKGCR